MKGKKRGKKRKGKEGKAEEGRGGEEGGEEVGEGGREGRREKRKKEKSLSCVRLFVTPWTVAYQGPLSIGFSRQEYWSGLPCPSPGDLPDPGIEPRFPTLRADALPSEPPGKPIVTWELVKNAKSQGMYQKLWV